MSTSGFQQFWNSTILLIFSESRNQFACHSQLLGQRVVWWQSPTTSTTRTSRAGAGRGRSGIQWGDSGQSPPRSGRNISVRMWLRMPLLYFNGMIFGHVRAHMLYMEVSFPYLFFKTSVHQQIKSNHVTCFSVRDGRYQTRNTSAATVRAIAVSRNLED